MDKINTQQTKPSECETFTRSKSQGNGKKLQGDQAMMKDKTAETFCLSDKKRIPFDCVPNRDSFYFYPEEDVKEFIKIIAEEVIVGNPNSRKMLIELRKLAGEKLI